MPYQSKNLTPVRQFCKVRQFLNNKGFVLREGGMPKFREGCSSDFLVLKFVILTELSNNKDELVKLHVGIFGYPNRYLLQFSVTDLHFR